MTWPISKTKRARTVGQTETYEYQFFNVHSSGKRVILESGEDLPLTFMNCASKCNSINCLIVGTAVSLMLTLVSTTLPLVSLFERSMY